jgi:hypothetical protein
MLVFFDCRILFKDKDRNWDDIENKLRAESEVPIVKTSSMVWWFFKIKTFQLHGFICREKHSFEYLLVYILKDCINA